MDSSGKTKDGAVMGSGENGVDGVELRRGGALGEASMVKPVRDNTGQGSVGSRIETILVSGLTTQWQWATTRDSS